MSSCAACLIGTNGAVVTFFVCNILSSPFRVNSSLLLSMLPFDTSSWVHHQRGLLRKFYATGQTFHGMNAARAIKLEEVGFILNVHEYKRNIKAISEESGVCA
mmetsp:Transcript_20335/g.58807  ORF Transcript_20335/g.58807 Transcript_20335/m.58807 type:complete len:103 (+) Transcript_20335:2265-2573(+)